MQAIRLQSSKRRELRQHREQAWADGTLDAEDMARALIGFRGPAVVATSAMRPVKRSADGQESAYVFDEASGMVYIVD